MELDRICHDVRLALILSAQKHKSQQLNVWFKRCFTPFRLWFCKVFMASSSCFMKGNLIFIQIWPWMLVMWFYLGLSGPFGGHGVKKITANSALGLQWFTYCLQKPAKSMLFYSQKQAGISFAAQDVLWHLESKWRQAFLIWWCHCCCSELVCCQNSVDELSCLSIWKEVPIITRKEGRKIKMKENLKIHRRELLFGFYRRKVMTGEGNDVVGTNSHIDRALCLTQSLPVIICCMLKVAKIKQSCNTMWAR